MIQVAKLPAFGSIRLCNSKRLNHNLVSAAAVLIILGKNFNFPLFKMNKLGPSTNLETGKKNVINM